MEDNKGPASEPAVNNGGEAPAEQARPAGDEQIQQLQARLDEAQAKADSYLDQLRRSVAEFSNYKKRVERENSELQKYATAAFIKKLLPVIDDLDRAFSNLPAELAGDSWVNGIDLVRQKLKDILQQEGVTAIDSDGQFDPMLHEAVTHEESPDHEENEIIGVVRNGYRMGDRILRPAQVRVARQTSTR